MSKKLNCWEYVNCGREKNGLMVPVLGECKVYSDMKHDGLNNGIGAGRACWMTHNKSCILIKSGQIACCFDCSFYKRVVFEEEVKVHRKQEPIAV